MSVSIRPATLADLDSLLLLMRHIEPTHRGQGIGNQLLDLAESASRGQGAQVLHLEVNHGNRAIELYRRHGFLDHQRYLMTKHLDN